MALVELIMPKMGESIMEATILNWLKKPGDKIEQDESVLEVATDKVDTEVPSTHGGILTEILAKQGEVVQVGKAIAIISTEGNEEVAVVTPTIEKKLVKDRTESRLSQTDHPHRQWILKRPPDSTHHWLRILPKKKVFRFLN
jgi:2-oxoglutarate dehydrogenase E2 component (dihydrolipoamide succinyltransferase)